MNGRRVIFCEKKGAAPAAASVTPVSVRMPAVPVMFMKSVTPAPDPLDAINWSMPITHAQFDTLAKAAAAGEIDMSDLARASEASLCRRPVPEGLRRVIMGTHLDPLTATGLR
ncbi:hypothetical protein [Paraburkholderia nemoris]|uniref:hypothetical protein n=1 Tax=Paraburkholderia nemoris TaxID=2793076 RepID=UPI001B26AABF|nr:hypothetical protein [Paraburkholderia nemoris]CAE6724913.1 hypothetical protein LMG22931_01912 [Paraburkholderia nemoris]